MAKEKTSEYIVAWRDSFSYDGSDLEGAIAHAKDELINNGDNDIFAEENEVLICKVVKKVNATLNVEDE